MTIKEFHNALLQGRGKCVQAVREDPEKYRDEVLWACRELVSFDTQSEGSKSWFIHEMVHCYPDRTPFVNAACEALIACPSDGSWHCHCLAELVERFFQDGHQEAWKALMKKYRMLYHQMCHVGPPEDNCYWAARDDYERLAVIFGWNREYCLDIARDMGRLSLETQWLHDWPFDWFYDTKARRYLRALTKAAETDPLLAEFYRVHEAAYQELQAQLAERKGKRKRLSPKCEDESKIRAAVEKYLSASAPDERAEALDAFFWVPYPADPSPVLADALSDHERLRSRAWNALCNTRHPAVREFAIAHLYDQGEDDDAFGAFCANYEVRDESLMLDYLENKVIDFEETTGWHGDQLSVLLMDKRKPLAPISALQFIFEHNYCSMCRLDTLRQLGKRRKLNPELLEECLYDSNDDIRTYARRALNRRKRRTTP